VKRRDFLQTAGLAAATAIPALSSAAPAVGGKQIEWKMVTAWPKNFPGSGAERLARRIGEMSDGRLTVKVYAAGELVPAFEVFDAVSQGTAEMGHATSYYWIGKSVAAQFFSSVPFGMTANEMNAWIYYGGGQALWQEVYAPFNLIPMLAGNTGVQMAGWFRREINSLADLKGMKMRVQGLAAEVLRRGGVVPVAMPAGEIFTSLQSGLLDAAEFTGPYNDLALGLYKAAKYYYYPGWHEPGTPAECTINKKAFERLPADLQSVVSTACQAMNIDVYAEYTARSYQALQVLVNEHQVQLRRLPDAVLRTLREHSADVRADIGARDATTRKVYKAYEKFSRQVAGWTGISETAFLNART
jgi:TRAP-type mannitol/chloroaromatic compound transport system substrate-binding protein